MNPLSQPVRSIPGVSAVSAVLSFLLALCGYLAAGCGSAVVTTAPPPTPPTPTSVTVVLSSTANGQFTSFHVDITSVLSHK
jgi:hypothetical protein